MKYRGFGFFGGLYVGFDAGEYVKGKDGFFDCGLEGRGSVSRAGEFSHVENRIVEIDFPVPVCIMGAENRQSRAEQSQNKDPTKNVFGGPHRPLFKEKR